MSTRVLTCSSQKDFAIMEYIGSLMRSSDTNRPDVRLALVIDKAHAGLSGPGMGVRPAWPQGWPRMSRGSGHHPRITTPQSGGPQAWPVTGRCGDVFSLQGAPALASSQASPCSALGDLWVTVGQPAASPCPFQVWAGSGAGRAGWRAQSPWVGGSSPAEPSASTDLPAGGPHAPSPP